MDSHDRLAYPQPTQPVIETIIEGTYTMLPDPRDVGPPPKSDKAYPCIYDMGTAGKFCAWSHQWPNWNEYAVAINSLDSFQIPGYSYLYARFQLAVKSEHNPLPNQIWLYRMKFDEELGRYVGDKVEYAFEKFNGGIRAKCTDERREPGH